MPRSDSFSVIKGTCLLFTLLFNPVLAFTHSNSGWLASRQNWPYYLKICHWVSVFNQCLLSFEHSPLHRSTALSLHSPFTPFPLIPLSTRSPYEHSPSPHTPLIPLSTPSHISKTQENSHYYYKWYFKRTESNTEAVRYFSYRASKVIPDNRLPGSFMDADHLLFTALKLCLLSNFSRLQAARGLAEQVWRLL